MKTKLKRIEKALLADEKGQGLTEYLILIMLIAVVSIGAAQGVGKQIKGKLKDVRNQIEREITVDGE